MSSTNQGMGVALLSVWLTWAPVVSMAGGSVAAQNPQGRQFGISDVVYFCDNSDPACTPATTFSLATLRDLYIFVQWTNVPFGTHTQEVKFFLPDARAGTLYQSFNNPFRGRHGQEQTVTLVDDVPIAGTFIEHRSLTGAWRVDVFLDGFFYTSKYVQLDP